MVTSPFLSTLSEFLLPGISLTLPPAILVNHLSWLNVFVMYKALQSEKIVNMHGMFISTRTCSSRVEKVGFSVEGTCVWFLGDVTP